MGRSNKPEQRLRYDLFSGRVSASPLEGRVFDPRQFSAVVLLEQERSPQPPRQNALIRLRPAANC